MRKLIPILLTAMLFCIGGLKASAYLTSTEYTNALNTIVTGKSYTIYTVVNGTKWYMKTDGSLTNVAAQKGVFVVADGVAGDYEKAYHFTFDDGGTTKWFGVHGWFHNQHPYPDGTFHQQSMEISTTNSSFHSQVLFMKGDGDQKGNYAIRAGND